ncbi:hypothetical protein MBLNU459_g2183t2 [Dothideomycetes sp. NU459]
MLEGEDLLLCVTCGTQYDVAADEPLDACRICDGEAERVANQRRYWEADDGQDPRQFVPETGQAWTSLAAEKDKHENKWVQDAVEKRMWSITAEPKLGIGQRAILLETPSGNILWDCIAFLSDPLIDFINSKGGLSAIVISHPHFYTTHLTWAAAFNCPVYTHGADAEWLSRSDAGQQRRRLIGAPTQRIVRGVTAIRVGGHFPGSMVLHWDNGPEGGGDEKEDGAQEGEEGGKKTTGWLGHADSFVNVKSGLYHINRQPGTTSYSFMYSIINMIPMDPTAIHTIWKAIKPFSFYSTHGLSSGWEIRGDDTKARILESMKIQVRAQGFETHELLEESV